MDKKEIPWNEIIKKLKGECSFIDDDIMSRWLADSKNAAFFSELQILWEQIRQESASYNPDASFYWSELSRRMEMGEKRRAQILRMRTLWKRCAVAACISVLLALSFFAGMNMVNRDVQCPLAYTNVRGKSKAVLPDLSVVWLHSATELSCDITTASNERVVRMEGEAYFDVKADRKRPFIVETGEMKIVVYGTKFNVEAFPESENVYVSLVEGSVELEISGGSRMLKPGEMATFNKQTSTLTIAPGDVAFASSWTRDEIAFSQQTLREICRFLSKWYGVKIDVNSDIADTYRYTFVLRNESLEEILRLMAHINPMWYSFNNKNELMIYKVE